EDQRLADASQDEVDRALRRQSSLQQSGDVDRETRERGEMPLDLFHRPRRAAPGQDRRRPIDPSNAPPASLREAGLHEIRRQPERDTRGSGDEGRVRAGLAYGEKVPVPDRIDDDQSLAALR